MSMRVSVTRDPSVAPEFYARGLQPRFRYLGETTATSSVGWAVAGGLLLGGVLGAFALVVINHRRR